MTSKIAEMHHAVALGMILTRCVLDMDPPCAISFDGSGRTVSMNKRIDMRVEIRPGEGGDDARRFAEECL